MHLPGVLNEQPILSIQHEGVIYRFKGGKEGVVRAMAALEAFEEAQTGLEPLVICPPLQPPRVELAANHVQQEVQHTRDAVAKLNRGCDPIAPGGDPTRFHGVGIALHPYQG